MGKYIGHSLIRVDARGKVTGQAVYPGDINLPGQAWMKVLFSQTNACHHPGNRHIRSINVAWSTGNLYSQRCAKQ